MDTEEAQAVITKCGVQGGPDTYGLAAVSAGFDNKNVYTIYPPMFDEQGQRLSREQSAVENKRVVEALHTLYPEGPESQAKVAVTGHAENPVLIQVVSDLGKPPHFLSLIAMQQETQQQQSKKKPTDRAARAASQLSFSWR